MNWFNPLIELIASNHLAIFRFSDDEWRRLMNSWLGVSQFTVARSHSVLNSFSVPAIGLLLGKESGSNPETYFGLVRSKHAVSTSNLDAIALTIWHPVAYRDKLRSRIRVA